MDQKEKDDLESRKRGRIMYKGPLDSSDKLEGDVVGMERVY